MKFSPTVPLALTFAAGVAGAALAQTAPNSGSATNPAPQITPPMTAGSTASQGQPSYAEPRQNATQVPNNANEQVRTAQQQLHAVGLYNGPVDGLMDPDTRAAIARFQQQNGLQPTESLDQPTLARLMSSQTTGSQSGTPAAAPAAPAGSSGSTPVPAGAGANTPAQVPGQSIQR